MGIIKSVRTKIYLKITYKMETNKTIMNET